MCSNGQKIGRIRNPCIYNRKYYEIDSLVYATILSIHCNKREKNMEKAEAEAFPQSITFPKPRDITCGVAISLTPKPLSIVASLRKR